MTNPYYANYLENQQALQKILEEAYMLPDHKNFHLGCTVRRGLSALSTVLFQTINSFLPIQNLQNLRIKSMN